MDYRAAIFVDGEYLRRVLNDEFSSARVDYLLLSRKVASPSEILRAYFYDCMPYQSSPPTLHERSIYTKKRRFLDALRMLPRFEVRLGRLERREDAQRVVRYEQKRVDILLGVDMVQLAAKGHIREAVLIAGDSDFIPAVAVAKSEGVIVRLFHGQHCHADLMREVDERRRIDQSFIDEIVRR